MIIILKSLQTTQASYFICLNIIYKKGVGITPIYSSENRQLFNEKMHTLN